MAPGLFGQDILRGPHTASAKGLLPEAAPGRTASGRRQPRAPGPQRDGAERFRQLNDQQTSRAEDLPRSNIGIGALNEPRGSASWLSIRFRP